MSNNTQESVTMGNARIRPVTYARQEQVDELVAQLEELGAFVAVLVRALNDVAEDVDAITAALEAEDEPEEATEPEEEILSPEDYDKWAAEEAERLKAEAVEQAAQAGDMVAAFEAANEGV